MGLGHLDFFQVFLDRSYSCLPLLLAFPRGVSAAVILVLNWRENRSNMFKINRFINQTRTSVLTSKQLFVYEHKLFSLPPQQSSTRFLDIYQVHTFVSFPNFYIYSFISYIFIYGFSLFSMQFGNKQAIEKERARL